MQYCILAMFNLLFFLQFYHQKKDAGKILNQQNSFNSADIEL